MIPNHNTRSRRTLSGPGILGSTLIFLIASLQGIPGRELLARVRDPYCPAFKDLCCSAS
jgi:hypothetical protein